MGTGAGWSGMGGQKGEREVSQGERGSRKREEEGRNRERVGIQNHGGGGRVGRNKGEKAVIRGSLTPSTPLQSPPYPAFP